LESANTKTIILSLKQAKSVFFSLVIRGFSLFFWSANGKTANNEGRLYPYISLLSQTSLLEITLSYVQIFKDLMFKRGISPEKYLMSV